MGAKESAELELREGPGDNVLAERLRTRSKNHEEPDVKEADADEEEERD